PSASATGTNAVRPLNLVWSQSLLDRVLEGYFIKDVLLAKVGRPVRTILLQDSGQRPLFGDALIVGVGAGISDYLREARARGGKNIGLFHMADEHGDHDRGFYELADYVIRNYWFEQALVQPNEQSLGVVWVPNGCRTGVGPACMDTMLGMAERTIM